MTVTDPSSIAERLGVPQAAVRRLQRRGYLQQLELDATEIRERIWRGHAAFTAIQPADASAEPAHTVKRAHALAPRRRLATLDQQQESRGALMKENRVPAAQSRVRLDRREGGMAAAGGDRAFAWRGPALRRVWFVALIACALLAATAGSSRGQALPEREHGGVAVVAAAAFGRPQVIDGTLEAEWAAAGRFDFAASLSAALGGGNVPARLYTMNDSNDLYFAFEIAHTNPIAASLEFNPIRPGWGGTDSFSFWTLPNPFFHDAHLCATDPPGWCLDRVEARMAWSGEGGRTIIEIARPLQTSEGDRDLQLKPGDRVPLGVTAFVSCPDPAPEACRGPVVAAQTTTLEVAADTAPPRVQALRSRAQRGKTAQLRFRLEDNDYEARVVIHVRRRGRPPVTLRTGLVEAQGGESSIGWRVPRVVRPPLSFCVRALDKAGNESPPSCAAITLSPV